MTMKPGVYGPGGERTRGALGARLANREDWCMLFAGSKEFADMVSLVSAAMFGRFPGALVTEPMEARVLDHGATVYLQFSAVPKSEAPELPHGAPGWEPGRDQDLFITIEPEAPDYVEAAATKFIMWLAGEELT